MVYDEITRSENDLSKWIKKGKLPVRKIDVKVTNCLKEIYSKDPIHVHLVDNIKQRSLADPWIIAHAINEEATVVTQENKETAINSKRIKIPNVCENMGVRWINDFQMIEELEIQFKCNLKEKN